MKRNPSIDQFSYVEVAHWKFIYKIYSFNRKLQIVVRLAIKIVKVNFGVFGEFLKEHNKVKISFVKYTKFSWIRFLMSVQYGNPSGMTARLPRGVIFVKTFQYFIRVDNRKWFGLNEKREKHV